MRDLLNRLAAAGRFAEPDEDPKPADTPPTEGDGEGEPKGGNKPSERIQTLVSERNAAQRQAQEAQAQLTALQQQIEQLRGQDQTAAVTTLQQEVEKFRTQINEVGDYFDGLLTTELAALPEESRALVEDVPGDARARYQFLVKHRARLTGAGTEPAKRTPPDSGTHDRKPDAGKPAGVSPEMQARIDRAKARTRPGTGWSAIIG
jgi:TolA-binding protein